MSEGYITPQINDAFNYISDILLVFSMFGCFCTVFTFMLFNEMRTYPIRLIIYLCIAIFLAQIFFYSTFYAAGSLMCIPCAMLLHYFYVANFIWTFCVAFNFYQMIVRRNRDAETLEKYYHIAAWIIPLIIVVVMASTHNYGDQGGYCYMPHGLPIFLGFFLPGLVIVSANSVIFFFIAREIHDTLKSAPKADKKEKSKEIKVYFSIFVSIGLSWIFGFVAVFMTGDSALVFLFLFIVTTPIQGFLIFISYCLNAKVAYRWASLIGVVIPYFTRFDQDGRHLHSGTGTTDTASSTRRTGNSGRTATSGTSASVSSAGSRMEADSASSREVDSV